MRDRAAVVAAVRGSLTPELLRDEYVPARGKPPACGHCYVASEAIWHLLGGRGSELTPKAVRHEGVVHWWLEDGEGHVIDVAARGCFDQAVPRPRGRRRAFLTEQPSQRAQEVLQRARTALRAPRPEANPYLSREHVARLIMVDFDGTLFNSQETPPPAWDRPGRYSWGSDPVSLSPPCVPAEPPAAYWNLPVVQAVREANNDALTMVVLVTGRVSSVRERVSDLLAQRGLTPDESYYNPGIDASTFKAGVLTALLDRHPRLRRVEVYENENTTTYLSVLLAEANRVGRELSVLLHLISEPAVPVQCFQSASARANPDQLGLFGAAPTPTKRPKAAYKRTRTQWDEFSHLGAPKPGERGYRPPAPPEARSFPWAERVYDAALAVWRDPDGGPWVKVILQQLGMVPWYEDVPVEALEYEWDGGEAVQPDDLAAFVGVAGMTGEPEGDQLLAAEIMAAVAEAGQWDDPEDRGLIIRQLADLHPSAPIRIVNVPLDVAEAFIARHHVALPEKPQNTAIAIGVEDGHGRLAAVATAGSPSAPWKRIPQEQIVELTRIASDATVRNASSMLAARVLKLTPSLLRGAGPDEPWLFVTYSLVDEKGSTYRALRNAPKGWDPSWGLRPVARTEGKTAGGARAAAGDSALGHLDKIRWEAGPAAGPAKWSLLERAAAQPSLLPAADAPRAACGYLDGPAFGCDPDDLDYDDYPEPDGYVWPDEVA